MKEKIKQFLKKQKTTFSMLKKIQRTIRKIYLKYLASDERILKTIYQKNFNKTLNLSEPRTFNEKIQYLKLKQRDSIFSIMSDKYAVRKYVEKKLNTDILTPLYWVGESPKKIPYDELPNSFVIKANHNSGPVIIVKNKNTLDKLATEKELAYQLKCDYYLENREYNYKNIPKKIIIEKLLSDNLNDYKLFCFNGIPEFIQVDVDRNSNHKRYFYDLKWNILPFNLSFSKNIIRFDDRVGKPVTLPKMIEHAQKLSEGLPFVRIDFYEVDKKLYFGEITLYHGSGLEVFYPDHEKWDKHFGNFIQLK